LTTYPANQFDTTGTLSSDAFHNSLRGCALTAQSIENIIVSLDTNGQQNIRLALEDGTNANASTWSTDAIIAYRNLINKSWTINQNGTPSMSELEYTISNSGTSFTLRSTGSVNYTVDWGDGSSLETSTSNTLAHTYSSSGTYVVKINSTSGATYRPRFDQSGDEDQIISIAVGSEDSAKFGSNIENAFRGAQNMTKYNQVGAATSAVTNFSRTWQGCSGITTFPLIDISNATTFNATWAQCSGFTEFPVLDFSSATSISAAWNGCTGITTFPTIDTSSVTNFTSTWISCSGLTTFPVLDTSSGTTFDSTWNSCTGLTSFPQIDTSSATNLRSAWRVCTGLTAFPVLNTSNVTDFTATWRQCSGITTFPTIDTSSGTSFQNTWRECTGITTFPVLDTSNGTNFTETWNGCTGITTFPILDTSSGTNFGATWQSNSSLTSFPSLDVSNGTNFGSAWNGCGALTSFPALSFSNGTSFGSAWRSCSGITTFPSVNFSNSTNFNRAWDNGFALTTYPANQFDTTGTLVSTAFDAAWSNCALTAQSIENILTSLDTNGAQNITLGISGGSNAAKSTWSTAANTAYNNLITKGWTISFNS